MTDRRNKLLKELNATLKKLDDAGIANVLDSAKDQLDENPLVTTPKLIKPKRKSRDDLPNVEPPTTRSDSKKKKQNGPSTETVMSPKFDLICSIIDGYDIEPDMNDEVFLSSYVYHPKNLDPDSLLCGIESISHTFSTMGQIGTMYVPPTENPILDSLVEIRSTNNKGKGLFAKQSISAGNWSIYFGELVPRHFQSSPSEEKTIYMNFGPKSGEYAILCKDFRSKSYYTNHGCFPTCVFVDM
jgi:hypothetical protein